MPRVPVAGTICVIAAVMAARPAGAAEFRVDLGEGDRIRAIGAAVVATVTDLRPCQPACRAWLTVEARVARWWPAYDAVDGRGLWDWNLLPALRIAADDRGGTVYVELGAGVHYLSETVLAHRGFGSNWQFGERLAVGALPERRIGWRVWLEHVSNGGFAASNNGVTFLGAGIQVPFSP